MTIKIPPEWSLNSEHNSKGKSEYLTNILWHNLSSTGNTIKMSIKNLNSKVNKMING
jgi:hypothetical protein